MAAREDQREPLVRDRAHILLLVLARRQRGEAGERLALTGQHALAAKPVDRLVPRGGDDPRARVRRDAVPGPPLECNGEGLLDGVLGEVEVAERMRECGDGTAPLLAERALDRLRQAGTIRGTRGRTSIVPPRAAGIRSARAIASSTSFASTA